MIKNKSFTLIIFLFVTKVLFSQTLNLPPRNISAQNGTQIIASITNLSLHDRETYIFSEIINGNIPDFYRNLIAIHDSSLIGSVYKHITFYTTPDYLALGCDSDYFLCPMTPILGQKIADTLNCTLPTRKMVNQISATATVNMQPQTISPSAQMITVPVFADHDSMVWNQRQTFFPANPLGYLVDGDKKDVIISNSIYNSQIAECVVIYGWHYPNGNIIQPLYSGHVNTYADYSHGIRLIQNKVYVDGDTMLASDILMSQTLCDLLSDEGVIPVPRYPDTTTVITIPDTPESFCIINESPTSVRIKILPDSNVTEYHVATSYDCINWGCALISDTNDFTLLGLTTDSIIYVMIAAANTAGTSDFSEVLAAVPSANQHKIIIVNGYDRDGTENTKDFIRQHGKAVLNYGYAFSSATNNAITDGLTDLNNFYIADYILGKESSVDKTFNQQEQTFVSDFLNNGGYLFVSGSEIAWDLDHLGDSTDKYFYNNYLKAEYIYDAPDNQSSSYYEFNNLNNTVFNGLGNSFFDDGTNGTYNVDYPDVISGINGGINGLEYSNLINNYAGVYFKGIFPNGTDTGKIVNLGFPFETVYPQNKRFEFMTMILDFFGDTITTSLNKNNIVSNILIYPNPATNVLNLYLPDNINYKDNNVFIYDVYGRVIKQLKLKNKELIIQITNLQKGIYFVKIGNTVGKFVKK